MQRTPVSSVTQLLGVVNVCRRITDPAAFACPKQNKHWRSEEVNPEDAYPAMCIYPSVCAYTHPLQQPGIDGAEGRQPVGPHGQRRALPAPQRRGPLENVRRQVRQPLEGQRRRQPADSTAHNRHVHHRLRPLGPPAQGRSSRHPVRGGVHDAAAEAAGGGGGRVGAGDLGPDEHGWADAKWC